MVKGPTPRSVSPMPARSMALPNVLNEPLAAAVSTRFLVLTVLVTVFIELMPFVARSAELRARDRPKPLAPVEKTGTRGSVRRKEWGRAARLSGRYDICVVVPSQVAPGDLT